MIFWCLIILITANLIADGLMMSLLPTTPSFGHKTEANVFDVDRYIFVLGIEPTYIISRHPKTA